MPGRLLARTPERQGHTAKCRLNACPAGCSRGQAFLPADPGSQRGCLNACPAGCSRGQAFLPADPGSQRGCLNACPAGCSRGRLHPRPRSPQLPVSMHARPAARADADPEFGIGSLSRLNACPAGCSRGRCWFRSRRSSLDVSMHARPAARADQPAPGRVAVRDHVSMHARPAARAD